MANRLGLKKGDLVEVDSPAVGTFRAKVKRIEGHLGAVLDTRGPYRLDTGTGKAIAYRVVG